ncbi:hypothetical protein PanWU01x14_266260 [Parasponia andersonii]|uniref:Uncharacterized protein n=1 Tax=Parasponia andersonii TaxID=3476 RepID=A0A2P5B700_PARAD|nr:hypothetical protein PanWU01x14_266260 [Parasponia andersonii]
MPLFIWYSYYLEPRSKKVVMSHTNQRGKSKNLSYCSEIETGGSSTYFSSYMKPTYKCGELAVIRVSWSNQNPGQGARTFLWVLPS